MPLALFNDQHAFCFLFFFLFAIWIVAPLVSYCETKHDHDHTNDESTAVAVHDHDCYDSCPTPAFRGFVNGATSRGLLTDNLLLLRFLLLIIHPDTR